MVEKRIGETTYRLKDPKTKQIKVAHIQKLKPFHQQSTPDESPKDTIIRSRRKEPVEKVTPRRKEWADTEYLLLLINQKHCSSSSSPVSFCHLFSTCPFHCVEGLRQKSGQREC